MKKKTEGFYERVSMCPVLINFQPLLAFAIRQRRTNIWTVLGALVPLCRNKKHAEPFDDAKTPFTGQKQSRPRLLNVSNRFVDPGNPAGLPGDKLLPSALPFFRFPMRPHSPDICVRLAGGTPPFKSDVFVSGCDRPICDRMIDKTP